jgi:hypothetical protein
MPMSFKGAHFPQKIILLGVRWYVAYLLSTRHSWKRPSTGASGRSGSATVGPQRAQHVYCAMTHQAWRAHSGSVASCRVWVTSAHAVSVMEGLTAPVTPALAPVRSHRMGNQRNGLCTQVS